MLLVLGLQQARLLLEERRASLQELKVGVRGPRDRRSRRMVLRVVARREEINRETRRDRQRRMRVDRLVARGRLVRRIRVGLPDRGVGRLALRGPAQERLVRREARRVRAPLVARRVRELPLARLLASRRARVAVSADWWTLGS